MKALSGGMCEVGAARACWRVAAAEAKTCCGLIGTGVAATAQHVITSQYKAIDLSNRIMCERSRVALHIKRVVAMMIALLTVGVLHAAATGGGFVGVARCHLQEGAPTTAAQSDRRMNPHQVGAAERCARSQRNEALGSAVRSKT